MARLLQDIWISYCSLPGWVQAWVVIILVPVNSVSIFYLGQPYGRCVAALAIGGMVPNLALMLLERGFSRAMSISHLILWIPLVLLVVWLVTNEQNISASFQTYLYVLLVVDLISLVFDFCDSRAWWRGNRNVSGK